MVKNDFKNDSNAEFVCDLVTNKFWEQTSNYTCKQLRKNYDNKCRLYDKRNLKKKHQWQVYGSLVSKFQNRQMNEQAQCECTRQVN